MTGRSVLMGNHGGTEIERFGSNMGYMTYFIIRARIYKSLDALFGSYVLPSLKCLEPKVGLVAHSRRLEAESSSFRVKLIYDQHNRRKRENR